ncbi:fucolectin-related protein, partial [Plakobranchus ocellatus]
MSSPLWPSVMLCLEKAVLGAQSQPCALGWFGDSCQFQCHCAGNTDCDPSNGACSSGCDPQWFGPGCQYNVSQITTSNGLWLTDSDDRTCNNDGNAESITVALVTPHPLTWVRVVVSDSTYVSDFQLSYRTPVSTSSEQCTEARSAKVDDNTLDIFCSTSIVVSNVTVSGPAVLGLCTLYISGGRNVALKQATEQSSRYLERYAKYAVDGTPSGPDIYFDRTLTCSHTSDEEMAPKFGWWRVTFSNDVEINRLIIYNRMDCCEDRLVNFTLQAYSSSGGNPVYSYTDPGGRAQLVYTVVPSPVIQAPVKSVRFDVSKNTKGSNIMTLCEVYAFGEVVCPPRKFGRQCERDCNCADQKEACFVSTGGCPSGCAAGYLGEDCYT